MYLDTAQLWQCNNNDNVNNDYNDDYNYDNIDHDNEYNNDYGNNDYNYDYENDYSDDYKNDYNDDTDHNLYYASSPATSTCWQVRDCPTPKGCYRTLLASGTTTGTFPVKGVSTTENSPPGLTRCNTTISARSTSTETS